MILFEKKRLKKNLLTSAGLGYDFTNNAISYLQMILKGKSYLQMILKGKLNFVLKKVSLKLVD